MASFGPFKQHILDEMDALADRHGLESPFLDAGCGRGDVAAHLAGRGLHGVALDVSDDAIAATGQSLAPIPGVEVVHGDLAHFEGGPFPTVVMLDVIEHIEDDRGALQAIARLQPPGGHLVMTVPTNPREWRWDDVVYGHVRRYEPAALRRLLREVGYDIVEMWDITFPVLWAMRRGYTAIKRSPEVRGTAFDRTRASSGVRTWEMGVVSWAVTHGLPWRLLFAWIRRNRRRFDRGHEVILLARRLGDADPAAG